MCRINKYCFQQIIIYGGVRMKIAIIGGTGVNDSSFMENQEKLEVDTTYGPISLIKGRRGNNEIFFLERHTAFHKLTPSMVNYKGNITALRKLNIDYVIATAAVGGIQNCNVGDFVIIDQFIDFTKNRSYTFYDGDRDGVVHIDMSEPYCPTIRKMLIDAFNACNAPLVTKGTYVCTEGPRFETPAEIKAFKLLGGDIVGMTNVPEVILARESELCYATVALVTNYAAGISKYALTQKEVSENMEHMSGKLNEALKYLIDNARLDKICSCGKALGEINTLK